MNNQKKLPPYRVVATMAFMMDRKEFLELCKTQVPALVKSEKLREIMDWDTILIKGTIGGEVIQTIEFIKYEKT